MGVGNGLTWAAVLTWFIQRTSWPEQPPNAAEVTEALQVSCELTQFIGVLDSDRHLLLILLLGNRVWKAVHSDQTG